MKINQLLESTKQKVAVFLVGAPGSGKSYIARKLTDGVDLKIVDIDAIATLMAKDLGINFLDQESESPEKISDLYDRAWRKNYSRLLRLLTAGSNILIDGTGKNFERLVGLKEEIESHGYLTAVVHVHTSLETAMKRNQERARKVPGDFADETWHKVRANASKIAHAFDVDRYFYIVNDADYDNSREIEKFHKFMRKI